MRSQSIWHPLARAVRIRQIIKLSGAVNRGTLRCAASGPYAVYVNGVLVGRGLGPDVAEVAVWERFELSALQEGENSLVIFVVGEGEKDWFRAEGEIEGSDVTARELNTGAPWEVQSVDGWQLMEGGSAYAPAVKSGDWVGAMEVAGLEPRDWAPLQTVEEDVWAREVVAFGEVDSSGPVEWVEFPEQMQTAKCVRREALLTAGNTRAQVQARDEGRAAYLLLDFNRVVSGLVRVRVRGRAGAVVDLGLAQERGAIAARLRYVCGDGVQDWTFPLLMSCRYMVVRVGQCPEEAEFDCISMMERRVDVAVRGRFETEGDTWTRIGQVGARSLAACRREVYELEPGRQAYDWRKLCVLALNDLYATGNVATARAMLASGDEPVNPIQAPYYTRLAQVAQGRMGGIVDAVECGDDLWSAFFATEALWQSGDGEQALALIEKTWGRLLDRSGRTWGEKAGSLEVQPGPDALLAAYMLGVRTMPDGVLEIRPQLAGRERAEGQVATPYGDVGISWGAYGGGFSMRAKVVHDGETRMAVPRRDKKFPQIAVNGETVWRNEKVYPNFVVQEFASEEERVVLVVRKAGKYEVEVQ